MIKVNLPIHRNLIKTIYHMSDSIVIHKIFKKYLRNKKIFLQQIYCNILQNDIF